jgi:hypothetical protein
VASRRIAVIFCIALLALGASGDARAAWWEVRTPEFLLVSNVTAAETENIARVLEHLSDMKRHCAR